MKYRVVSFQNYIKEGYDPRKVTARLLQLVNLTLDDISPVNVGEVDQWLPILLKVKDCCYMLVETTQNIIVGHWFFSALDEEVFKKAINGTLLEINMTIDTVKYLDKKGIYYGYFNQIEILEKHKNIKTFKMLIESFFDVIENFAKEGIFFFRWATLAASKEGQKLALKLGLKYTVDHQIEGMIFSGNIFTMTNAKILSRYPLLVEAYAKKYDEINN